MMDLFLEGFDPPWIVCERARFQAKYVALLRQKIARAIERGDLVSVGEACEEILRVDNYQEYAHLGLMASLAGSGQRVLAAQKFSSYQSIMRKEMFMDVLPDAKNLAHMIRSGECSRKSAMRYLSEHLF